MKRTNQYRHTPLATVLVLAATAFGCSTIDPSDLVPVEKAFEKMSPREQEIARRVKANENTRKDLEEHGNDDMIGDLLCRDKTEYEREKSLSDEEWEEEFQAGDLDPLHHKFTVKDMIKCLSVGATSASGAKTFLDCIRDFHDRGVNGSREQGQPEPVCEWIVGPGFGWNTTKDQEWEAEWDLPPTWNPDRLGPKAMAEYAIEAKQMPTWMAAMLAAATTAGEVAGAAAFLTSLCLAEPGCPGNPNTPGYPYPPAPGTNGGDR